MKSIDETITTFDEVVSKIEAKNFDVEERPVRLCKDCDMSHYCDANKWN